MWKQMFDIFNIKRYPTNQLKSQRNGQKTWKIVDNNIVSLH